MLQPPTPPPITTAPALLFTRRSVPLRVSLAAGTPLEAPVSDEHVTIDDILPRVEQLAGADRVVTRAARRAHEHELQGRGGRPRATSCACRRRTPGCSRSTARTSTSELAWRRPRRASARASSPTCPSSGALVLDFIEGSTMSAEDLRARRPPARGRRGDPRAARLPALPRRLQHVPRAGALRRASCRSAACACPSATSSSPRR